MNEAILVARIVAPGNKLTLAIIADRQAGNIVPYEYQQIGSSTIRPSRGTLWMELQNRYGSLFKTTVAGLVVGSEVRFIPLIDTDESFQNRLQILQKQLKTPMVILPKEFQPGKFAGWRDDMLPTVQYIIDDYETVFALFS